MIPLTETSPRKSRLAALLEHFSQVEDARDVRRILHPLPEVLLLVVCGTIADCDDYEDIAAWGAAHLDFLRQHLPYVHGVPGERWLTILMNRVNPALFADAFAGWVRELAREGQPGGHRRQDLAPQPRRRRRRAAALVSAFATTARLVLAQEAVPDKANELAAIPLLLERLGAEDGLKGALVSIDAIATNADVAEAIIGQGADWLLAVKANQPTLRAEVEAAFAEAPTLETGVDLDKGHGRIEERRMAVLRETGWLAGERRFPARCASPAPPASSAPRPASRPEARPGPRPAISSRPAPSPRRTPPPRSGNTGRSRTAPTGSSTSLLPTTRPAFAKATARETSTVRHFALNLVRTAADKRSIKSRRKLAGWDPHYLNDILSSRPA